ncbi:zinc transporter ZIP13-like isoform X2 [Physella acuta]|uniref:zinc transporter ZIP13-like isoform X2 n=1 Tax=Physella acuta TaxID=109671 RepID=UPI0027DCEA0D|nr:zinc transporter ZIP13-like isoform X2 [Physella acuta]
MCAQIHLTNGEIHRAKSTPLKSVKRAEDSTLGLRDFDTVSDVAKMNEEGLPVHDGGGESILIPRQTYEIWIYSILAAILVGLSGIFPLLVIPLESGQALKHGAPAKKLRLMLSFAVGSLLGDVFLHLLPEVWAHIEIDDHGSHRRVGLWVITGLLSFMIIEKLMGDEHEFDPLEDTCDEVLKKNGVKHKTQVTHRTPAEAGQRKNKKGNSKKHKQNTSRLKVGESLHNGYKTQQLANGGKNTNSNNNRTEANYNEDSGNNNIKVSGYLNLMANVVDNFTHGLAVAGSFCISTKVGLITTLAILLHEIPHEVGDFAILLRSGFNRWKAAKAQFLTASGGVVGAITALSAESAQIAGDRTAWILPFTSGGFMYIALVTVVPDLLQEKHGGESLKQVGCICLGVLAMVIVTLAFD